MSLSVTAAARTDTGRVREANEDSYFAGTRVFCVADGLGGHLAGEVASQLAAKTIAELDSRPTEEAVTRLGETVRKANRLVHDEARSDSTKSGMGTTMTAVVVDSSSAHLAHVGDSRCYLLRDGDVTLLTEDHTVVGRMVSDGLLTAEQATQHPQRSMLTRALGTAKHVDVDVTHASLHGGDRLLLCSDGLTAVVEPNELARLLSASDDLQQVVDSLIDLSLERGAPDNVTVVLLDIAGTPSGGARPGGNESKRRTPRRQPAVKRVMGIPRRAIIWALLIALVIAGGIIGIRQWVDGSYFVSFNEDEQVSIYNGVPVDVPIFATKELLETYEDIPARRVREFQRPEIQQGVLFDSLDEARAYVDGLREDLIPAPSPTGKTSPKPSEKNS